MSVHNAFVFRHNLIRLGLDIIQIRLHVPTIQFKLADFTSRDGGMLLLIQLGSLSLFMDVGNLNLMVLPDESGLAMLEVFLWHAIFWSTFELTNLNDYKFASIAVISLTW